MLFERYSRLVTHEDSFIQKWRKIAQGLNAPPDTGSHKYAVSELQRIIGPSSTSTVICTAVLLALMFFVQFDKEGAPAHAPAKILPTEIVDLPDPIEDPPELEPDPEWVDMDMPVNDIAAMEALTATLSDAVSMNEPVMDPIQAAVSMNPSVLKMIGLPSGRIGGPSGIPGSPTGGAPTSSIAAVLKALRWLKDHQNDDGSWSGSDSRTGMTGLALLCYIAHGETPTSEEFGITVEKAIRHLLYVQQPNGRFKGCGENYVYGHAIATYALAETYTMTPLVILRMPLKKAVRVIIDGQQEGGAWDYEYSKTARRDLSVSAWQVQALKAASLSFGKEIDGLQDTLEKATLGVQSFAVGEGYLSYGGKSVSQTLTAAGILSMQMLGRADSRLVRDAVGAIRDIACDWGGNQEHNNTYSWYYATQAFFHYGEGQWGKWKDKMLPMLVQNQEPDGHWSHGGTYSSSPVYDTTMCCLTLEIWYRHLPTYNQALLKRGAPEIKESGDIVVDVFGASERAL